MGTSVRLETNAKGVLDLSTSRIIGILFVSIASAAESFRSTCGICFWHSKVPHTRQEDETRESILRESVFGVAQQFPQRAYHRANRNHDDSERNENDGRGGIGMLRRKPSQEDDDRIFAEAQRHI
jgi:hypothetical protein